MGIKTRKIVYLDCDCEKCKNNKRSEREVDVILGDNIYECYNIAREEGWLIGVCSCYAPRHWNKKIKKEVENEY